MFINCTPHPINVYDKDNNLIVEIQPSGIIPRVNSKREFCYKVKDIPVYETVYGMVENLPTITEGNLYIVSRMIKAVLDTAFDDYYMEGNKDKFIVPDDILRDDKGNIIGCKSFSL
jgi:hypothetical protein